METYPERLGVFPLPQLVLFPHVHLPLHVFEPRYRALLEHAMAGDRRFVMAVLKPGYEENYYGTPDVYPLACAGRVVKHQTLPDGCSDVVLRGERVVHLEEFLSDSPFRVARLRVEPDDTAFAQSPDLDARLAELRVLLERACPGATRALESRLMTRPEQDGGLELLHTLASSFPVSVDQKLEWLGAGGTMERWRRIRDVLEKVGLERTRKARALMQYADLKPEDPKTN